MQVFPYDRVPDGSTVLATNLFTNPNLVGDGTYAEYRRNLAPSPQGYTVSSAVGGTVSIVAVSSPLLPPSVSSASRIEWVSAPTSSPASLNQGTVGTGGMVVTAGETYTASMYTRRSFDLSAERIDFTFYDAAGVVVLNSNGPTIVGMSTAHDWARQSRTMQAPAGAAYMRVLNSHSGPQTNGAGGYFEVTGWLIEKSATVNPYFDGSSPQGSIDPDMRQRWLGAANASESVMESQNVRAVTGGYLTTGWPDHAAALRVAAGKTATFTALAGETVIVYARNAGQTIGGVAGVAGENRVTAAGTVTLGPGDWVLPGRYPAGYDGPAFSGDTPDDGDIFHEWSGAANSSTSKRSLRNFLPVASDMTPHTIVEVDDLDPGVSFITVWRDDGARWQEVRGALMAPVAGSWAGVDWECGFNRATAYRVEQFDAAGLSLGLLPAVTVTLASTETWVQNVMAPRAGTPVMWTDSALRDIDRPTDSEVVFARGATYGTAVGSARRGIVGVNLEMVTDTLEQADKVQGLLGSPGNELPPVLCVRKGAGEGFARIPATLFVHVGSINEVDLTVRFGGENVVHQTSGTEVRPPAKKLGTPLLTLADLDAFYATLGDIDADNLTLGDIDRRWDLAGYATV